MKIFMTVTFIIQLTLAKAKIESGITNGLARYSLFLYYCVEYTLTPRVFGAIAILPLYNI